MCAVPPYINFCLMTRKSLRAKIIWKCVMCYRCEGSTSVGLKKTAICWDADNHRLHQDPADVLHITFCHHGGAGGTQARHMAQ